MNVVSEKKKEIILFVDDNKLCHKMLKLIISDLTTCTIISAYGGREAIGLSRKYRNQICLVLSDVMMDDLNGYELYEAFKKDRLLKDIPFIFQSGFTLKRKELKKHNITNIEILYKPYKQDQLLSFIAKILGQQILVKKHDEA